MQAKSEKAFPLKRAYPFAEEHGLTEEARRIRDIEIRWDRPYTSSVRRGFMIELFQRHGILAKFKEACWPHGFTSSGMTEERRYLRIKSQFDAYLGTPHEEPVESGEDEFDRAASEMFALESHLRDYLAKNPEKLEPDLRLYATSESEGVEYPVDDGRIDILAIDKQDRFVVVELKLSRGRNRALGQILYYMGWVDQNLGKGPCRGIIVANDITQDLVTAVDRVPGVTLYRYRMSFSVDKVSRPAA